METKKCPHCGRDVIVCEYLDEPGRTVTLTAPIGSGANKPFRRAHVYECQLRTTVLHVLNKAPASTEEVQTIMKYSKPLTTCLNNAKTDGLLTGNVHEWRITQKGIARLKEVG